MALSTKGVFSFPFSWVSLCCDGGLSPRGSTKARQMDGPIKWKGEGRGTGREDLCCRPGYAHARRSRVRRNPLSCFPLRLLRRLQALITVDPLLGLKAASQEQHRLLEDLQLPALGSGHGDGIPHRRHYVHKRAPRIRPLRTIRLVTSLLLICCASSSRDCLDIHGPEGE